MSGTFPTSPGFADIKIVSWQPTLVSLSHSLQRQVRSRGGAQRWAIEATYPPNLRRAELAPIFAFAVAQRGQYGKFTLQLPDLWANARGAATGTPVVYGAGQTGRTVLTAGWTPNTTAILLLGDLIKFAGHDKVYMVTASTSSDASGRAYVAIEPALLSSPANNAAVSVSNISFVVSFSSDVQEVFIRGANRHEYKVSFVEIV